jgi:hypothetical protein
MNTTRSSLGRNGRAKDSQATQQQAVAAGSSNPSHNPLSNPATSALNVASPRENVKADIFLSERNASINQSKREIAEFRHREREMEAYGLKWGTWAMRRKYPIAKERAEEKKRRKEVESDINRRGRRVQKRNEGRCIVV